MAFFIPVMNIFIYSDESGVFDYIHNDYFVFGGLICFGQEEKENISRKYAHAEKEMKRKYINEKELKASIISNEDKSKLFRSLNNIFKFCVVIKQKNINKEVFSNKKHKQRYLDYVYKIVLKKCFEKLIKHGFLNPNDVKNIYVNVDEHTTATDGRYELMENLRNEFKYGTFNYNWDKYFEPIFDKLETLEVNFCDSKNKGLIRAADIIANHYYSIFVRKDKNGLVHKNTFILTMPDAKVIKDGFNYFLKK